MECGVCLGHVFVEIIWIVVFVDFEYVKGGFLGWKESGEAFASSSSSSSLTIVVHKSPHGIQDDPVRWSEHSLGLPFHWRDG